LKVVSANLNGIRSAADKGFFEWLARQRAGVAAVQEVKAQHEHVDGRFCRCGALQGYFHYARKKGYSGVGLYVRQSPSDVIAGIGVKEFDDEGRWIEARYDRPGRRLSFISCYFPSGTTGDERQQAKFRFLDVMYPKLAALKAEREFLLLGDVNIAHREIDLKNWRSNQKNSGFLPEERAWLTRLFGDGGLVDVYRLLEPEASGAAYTWWSQRGRAWENNVGWRIDYQIATPAIARTARSARVYKAARFSDHAPLVIDYELTI
jgi:exodeoxyribonuclease-3